MNSANVGAPGESIVSSHRLKIDGARQHLQKLDIEIGLWVEGNEHLFTRIEPDPHNPANNLWKVYADDVPATPFSLLIGDVVQNIRSSLDHIVFALAVENLRKSSKSLTKKEETDTQFPIVGNENRDGTPADGATTFTGTPATKNLKHVCAKAKAVIEGVQPFLRGADFGTHPLWWLHGLSNTDKHRVLHLGAAVITGTEMEGGDFDGPISFQYPGAIKKEAIIARIGGAFRPNRQKGYMKVNFGLDAAIAFSDGPLANRSVVPVLTDILNFVVSEVLTPLETHL